MATTRRQTDMGWGPGYGPFPYTLLSEPTLSLELRRLAEATTHLPGVDSVNFQPCLDPSERSQDRHAAQRWAMPDGQWTFCGVFDGHAGPDTAEYTARTLPTLVRDALAAAFTTDSPPSVSAVNALLVDAIKVLDDSIVNELLLLFPEAPEELERMSDAEVRARLDKKGSDASREMLSMCIEGSTVLVSLTDPGARNLWVASLGDCRAVLGVRNASEGTWDTSILSFNHNAANEKEADALRTAHPGEKDVICRDRVLGGLAVTRAVGDHIFKLPSVYTRRVFGNVHGGPRFLPEVLRFLDRNHTPPYVSNVAEVRHVALPAASTPSSPGDIERVLILASDGLVDLGTWPDGNDSGGKAMELAQRWIERAVHGGGEEARLPMRALSVLRDALGGDDVARVSRMMTVEMMGRWTDDTTVVVQAL